MAIDAVVFTGLIITACVGLVVIRTDARRFEHIACALMACFACIQATLALAVRALQAGPHATILARIDTALWAMGAITSVAFVVAFPLGRPPGPRLRRFYLTAVILGVSAPIWLPRAALGPAIGSLAIVVGVVAINGGFLQIRRLSHPRGASARLIAAAGILATWGFIGAAATFADAAQSVAPTPAPAMVARGAPLVAATMACFAAAHYSLVNPHRVLASAARWLLAGAALAAGFALVRRLSSALQPASAHVESWSPDLSLAAAVISMFAVVLAVIQRDAAEVGLRGDTSMLDTAAKVRKRELPGAPRETLVALDRLTDPLAVQERVVEALTELLPGAKLELLRARISPPGILTGAREVSTSLALAAVRRGYLARHQIDELDLDCRKAFERLGGALVVPVRCDAAVFGVLHLDHPRVDRAVIVQARRFADLLGFKLETHRLYAELETQRRLASLGTLATALAHDLRTPLAAIRMNIQMLQMRSDVLGDDIECLDIALSEVDRLNAQIETLLDFARPMDLDVDKFDIGALVTEATTRVAAVASHTNVALSMEIESDLPRLPGDPSRLSRVLVNLIENAVQASSPGAQVKIQAFSTSEVVDVVISDRGRGIASEDLPRIFDPFFTTRADGTGLGLAICRKIVQTHGGQILVKSEVGYGSEFRLRLPVRRAPEELSRAPDEAASL